MSTLTGNITKSASGSTSAESAGPDSIPARLQANVAAPDVADFLRLLYSDRPAAGLSYRAVMDEAVRYARAYRRHGLRPGDHVVIVLEHSPDLYASFLGALWGGFVPGLWSFPSPKIADDDYFAMLTALVHNSEARLMVTSPTLRARLEASGVRLGGIRLAVTGAQRAGDDDEAMAPFAPAPDGTAFLQYSSGTTGLKKGVAISHRALLWQVDRYAEAIRLDQRDRIVSWLPLYHDMGLIACLFLPLIHRIPLVALCPFQWVQRPAAWLEAVSAYRGTLSWLPNFAYGFLARPAGAADPATLDLSSLRGLVNCSEPILAESHERFAARFEPAGFDRRALAGSYAMAENTFAVTSGGFGRPLAVESVEARALARDGRAIPIDPSSAGARTLVSSGRALPETTIVIVDGEGRALADRHLGEIVIESPCLMSAYYRNDAATKRSLRDGRLFTGDQGYLAGGELFVTGRLDDLIVVRGQNLYPQDVESIVNDVPGVVPGRNVAVGAPDERLGTDQLVILAETHEPSGARRAELQRAIRQRVAHATEVVPGDVRLVEHMWLRKSTAGKISRRINRQRYLELADADADAADRRASAAPRPAAGEDAVLAQVRAAVRRVVSRRSPHADALADDQALITSGLIDSLDCVELIHALEAGCGLTFAGEDLADWNRLDTVGRIAELVRRVRARGDRPERQPALPRSAAEVPLTIGKSRAPRRLRGWWSRYYRLLLRRRGVEVGRGLCVRGPLILRFDGDPRNVRIGNDVTLMPGVDLKVRENGRIILHDGVTLDTNVRLVAAREARIELGENAQLGMCTVINAGADVIIGRRSVIAGFSLIAASEHRYLGREPFMAQGYDHEPIFVGEDVWGGAYSFVGRGSRIGNGAVLGMKSVVRGDVPAWAVAVGNPARVVRYRGSS